MNMRTSTILLAGVLLLSGCKKFLDTRIDTSQTQADVNSNYATLFSFAVEPYSYLRDEFTVMDGNLFASVTDEAKQTAPVSNAYLFTSGGWNASINPDNYYANYYAGIRAANYFLQNSVNYPSLLAQGRDTVSASGKVSYANDVENISWYRAEAHVARAWFYFELSKRYGGVPLVTEVMSADQNTIVPKVSYDTIIHYILSEIAVAADSLQPNWKTSNFGNYDGRFTLGAALALKARTLLFYASPLNNTGADLSRWDSAASALHDVVTFAAGAGQYSIDPSYGTYFLQDNLLSSPETIFAIRYVADNVMETANYPIGTPGGNSGETPSQNLVSAYEYTGAADPLNPYNNRDPRLSYTVVTNNSTWNGRTINEAPGGTDDMAGTNASKTGYYLKKFLNDGLNLTQGQTVVHNWPVFRFGEVLLEYAEAMNEAYGPDADNGYGLTARTALNMVRARPDVAMPAVTVTSQADFRTAVKHERQIELAFEDYRYWDLLRWKDAAAVLSQPLQGVRVTASGYQVFNVENRVFDAPKMYLYPFPQTEISKSGGVLVQNPGW